MSARATMMAVMMAAALASSCDGVSEELEPYLSPDERGPAAVGTSWTQIDGPDGVELVVQLWFPAASPPAQDARPVLYDGLIEGEAYEGLEPDCSSSRPVAAFSHGNTGFRWQSTYLPEHLASRGYVVVAPDHRYNTFADYDEERIGEVALRRPADLAAAFDWAASLPELDGCIDPAAGYAVMGHSFGGYTALAAGGATLRLEELDRRCGDGEPIACDVAARLREDDPEASVVSLADGRVWAVLALAPWDGGGLGAGLADVSAPTVVLGGELDATTSWDGMIRPIYEQLEVEPRYLGQIEGAAHGSFLGICDWVAAQDREGCGDPWRDFREVNAMTREVAAAFFDLSRGDRRAAAFFPVEAEGLGWTSVTGR